MRLRLRLCADQKEKYKADFKKKITRLHTYKDQIKTWLQSTKIKKDKKVSFISIVFVTVYWLLAVMYEWGLSKAKSVN